MIVYRSPRGESTVQNKLLFAITGHTAAELVRLRINPESVTFGLTSWQGERPMKADATIAKNYLTEDEIRRLDRLTTQWPGFAEARRKREYDEAWEVEAADITKLLEIESGRDEEGSGDDSA